MAGTPRVAIVGGGIGGLAAGAFLHRAGLPAVVFEQAPALKEVGAGVVLAPNVVRLLRRLGVMEELARHAVPLDVGWEFRRWEDGRVLSAEDLAASCEQLYGERTHTAHRADLHTAIAAAVTAGSLHLGRRCTGVSVSGDRAVLAFADGSSAEADVVIGADGMHSVVRRCLADDLQAPARALQRYESLRIGRTTRLQQISHARAHVNHLPDGPEQEARDQALAAADPLAAGRWIYAYDPGKAYDPEKTEGTLQ